jgi:hypothetical protein
MKTNELIEQLASQNEAFASADRDLAYLTKWFAAAAGAMIVWFVILPARQDLVDQLQSPRFLIESATWLALAVASGCVAARARLPGAPTKTLERVTAVIGLILLFEILLQPGHSTLSEEFRGELSWWRGRCGPLILAMALSWSGGLFYWMRQGAVLNARRSGVWAAISAGALSAFAMQMICAHENTIHLLIWHVLPTALLGAAGYVMGRRLLRW